MEAAIVESGAHRRLFSRFAVGAVLATTTFSVMSGFLNGFIQAAPEESQAASDSQRPTRTRQRFPDFKFDFMPPAGQYAGSKPLFRLSQDFPHVCPQVKDDQDLVDLLEIDFDEPDLKKRKWYDYLIAVRDYCFRDNIDPKGTLATDVSYDDDWQQEGTFRKWYHVPWQHFGDKGREGIHGLTREASAKPGQLGPKQVREHDTYAVAVYNAIGGYTIGQVWEEQFEPRLDAAIFEEGTVVAKVLFTQADESEVPFLHDALVWEAYVRDPADRTKRKVQKLRLLQMDVMVRDNRARKTGGWVFGTYCYNGSVDEKNKWRRLVPVGIQWGNDENYDDWAENDEHTDLRPLKGKHNPKLKETIINHDDKDLPAQHLGWGGRLNGPADYYRSSCVSCHSTAQYPGSSPQHPDFEGLGHEPGDEQWMRWFRNLDCGESFDSKTATKKRPFTMDFSLQLQIGIENFYKWKSATMGGYFTFRDDTFEPVSEPQK